MTITLNGQPREFPTETTILGVLESMKLTPQKVAVELNRRLLKADRYSQTLGEGDQVEVVTFVGGG